MKDPQQETIDLPVMLLTGRYPELLHDLEVSRFARSDNWPTSSVLRQLLGSASHRMVLTLLIISAMAILVPIHSKHRNENLIRDLLSLSMRLLQLCQCLDCFFPHPGIGVLRQGTQIRDDLWVCHLVSSEVPHAIDSYRERRIAFGARQ
jgi:hypothetical protein